MSWNRQMLDGASVGLLLHDEQFRFLDASAGVHEVLGYTPDQLIGRSLGDIEDNFDANGIRTTLLGLPVGEKMTVRGTPRHADGTQVEVRVDVRRMSDQPPRFVATVAADEHRNDAHRRFMRHASHELRSPLHTVIGFGQLLAERVEDDAVASEWLSNMLQSARTMNSLLEDMLRYRSAAEAAARREEVDLSAQVQRAVAIARRHHAVPFIVDADDGGIVVADPIGLQQILVNLLNTSASRATGEVRLTVGQQALEVRHDGTNQNSIPPQEARLLGLPLSRTLAQAMGGHLSSKGSLFRLQLRR